MGKKQLDKMAEQKGLFVQNSAKHGMTQKQAEELFEQIEQFAAYCFNRSHSAAYAFVAYQTAYLKHTILLSTCLLFYQAYQTIRKKPSFISANAKKWA